MPNLNETDALIVGGGPAGLASAIAIRAKGFRAVVVDRASPAIDKACGEGLLPDSLVALRSLGIAVPPEDSYAFRGIRFHEGRHSVDASFVQGHGLGVRRTRLHQLLVSRAADMGVNFRWGVQVSGLSAAGAVIDRREMRCRWIIGADGQDSRVRRWAGIDPRRQGGRRFGFRRHYRVVPWTDCTEIYWGDHGQIYVTPVGPEEVCVALITRDPRQRLDTALPAFPEVARRLEGSVPVSAERGAVTASRTLKQVSAGRVALVGDASGSVDAITGEGLCLAFRQALALADALESAGLAGYERAHRRIMRRPCFMASLLMLLDRSSGLRRCVIPALCARPEIFATLLSLHVGALTPAAFFTNGILPLGRRMLRA